MNHSRSSDKGRFPFALWLCPDPESTKRLSPLVQAFAHKSRGPEFPLHLTLASGSLERMSDREPWQNQVLPVSLPLVLEPSAIECQSSFFQSAYVTFAKHEALEKLHAHLCEALDKPRAWQPHLSLVYGDIPLAEKLAIIRELELPSQGLYFDRMECWAPKPGFTWQDIEQWQRIPGFFLQEPSTGGT